MTDDGRNTTQLGYEMMARYERLMSYNSMSFQELCERKQELTAWLYQNYEEQINSMLMLNCFEPIPIDLQDGMSYTLDYNYQLTCHGCNPEYLKSGNNTTSPWGYSTMDKLTIIADILGKGYYGNPMEFYTPFVTRYEYYPVIMHDIDELTLSGIKCLDEDDLQLTGDYIKGPKNYTIGQLNLPDIEYLGVGGIKNLKIVRLNLPNKPVELIHGRRNNVRKYDPNILYLGHILDTVKETLFDSIEITNTQLGTIQTLKPQISFNFTAGNGLKSTHSNTMGTVIYPQIKQRLANIISASQCIEVGKDGVHSSVLKELHLPNCRKIDDDSIRNCRNLEFIDLSGLDITQMKECNPILSCSNLKRVFLPREFEGTDIIKGIAKYKIEYV